MIEDGGRGSTKRGFCQQSGHPDDSKCCFIKKDDSKLFCCRCAHKRRASPLTCLAICFLVLTYNLLGGFLFLAIEGGTTAEETSVAASKPNPTQQAGGELRSQTVERLWSITEDLNILYKENWTKLAAKELMDFQKVLLRSTRGSGSMHHDPGAGYRWTFSGSFLYALTLITTIGHGNVAPRSSAGRIAAVAYACVGIPIVMLYLSTIGEALARNFRILYSKICPARLKSDNFHSKAECLGRYSFPAFECRQYADCDKSDKHRDRQHATPFQAALNLDTLSAGYHWTCRDHTRVPILLSLVVVASYVILGTFVFHTTEKWDLIDGCYFSFSSLATIGFGNLKPGLHAATVSAKAEDVAVGVCCVYILVGIVVVAMCFNLVQEDAGAALRHVAVLCAGAASPVPSTVPSAGAEANGRGGCGERGGRGRSRCRRRGGLLTHGAGGGGGGSSGGGGARAGGRGAPAAGVVPRGGRAPGQVQQPAAPQVRRAGRGGFRTGAPTRRSAGPAHAAHAAHRSLSELNLSGARRDRTVTFREDRALADDVFM